MKVRRDYIFGSWSESHTPLMSRTLSGTRDLKSHYVKQNFILDIRCRRRTVVHVGVSIMIKAKLSTQPVVRLKQQIILIMSSDEYVVFQKKQITVE